MESLKLAWVVSLRTNRGNSVSHKILDILLRIERYRAVDSSCSRVIRRNRPITCRLVKHTTAKEKKIKRDQGETEPYENRGDAITREGSSIERKSTMFRAQGRECSRSVVSYRNDMARHAGIPKRSPIKTFPIDFPWLNSPKSKVSSELGYTTALWTRKVIRRASATLMGMDKGKSTKGGWLVSIVALKQKINENFFQIGGCDS